MKNKKVLVMGLGLHGGGVGVVKWLVKQGAQVTVTDLKSEKELCSSVEKLKGLKVKRFIFGKHLIKDFREADMVVKNPGVPKDSSYLKIAGKHGVPIETDISLFWMALNPKSQILNSKQNQKSKIKNQNSLIIGVTGTRGKSTTATLIHEMLKKKYPRALLGGNIRVSPLDLLDRTGSFADARDDIIPIVLELSSWQLEDMTHLKVSPHVAVVTNVMQDHLDRYHGMADYIKAKENIFKFQSADDFVVLNRENVITRRMGKKVASQRYWFGKKEFGEENGVFVKLKVKSQKLKVAVKSLKFQSGEIFFRRDGRETKLCRISDIRLLGEHNLENALAAVSAARIMGVSAATIRSVLKTFKGVSERLELVRSLHGVKYYDDTTATTPEAAMAALRTLCSKKKNIILICGGADKKLKFDKLAKEIKKYCKAVVLLPGTATGKLKRALVSCHLSHITSVKDMRQAAKEAQKLAVKDDIVILSPACASFGLFSNEFHRGKEFIYAVKKLN